MPKTRIPNRSADEFLIAGWSKLYGREIGLDEVREINANLSAFVDVMERIDRYLKRRRETAKNGSGGLGDFVYNPITCCFAAKRQPRLKARAPLALQQVMG